MLEDIKGLYHEMPFKERMGSAFRIHPVIEEVDGDIRCNELVIPTRHKQITLKLFRLFLSRKRLAISREEMISWIYAGGEPLVGSARYYQCISHNMVKLISRARCLADNATNKDGSNWIEWFCYNSKKEEWVLYQLTNSFLIEKERQIRGFFGEL